MEQWNSTANSRNFFAYAKNVNTLIAWQKLIVRTSNHVLYVSNESRLARQDFFSICECKQKNVWPSSPGYVTDV